VIVPDKSTIYRPYMLDDVGGGGNPDIISAAVSAGINSVNLLDLFRQHIVSSVDLYLPNDTHLSVSGYELMGTAIAERIKNSVTR
jgi:lysophospholipase L1-like esterase